MSIAKLIRQRYREAADMIKKGKMCALFINDLDAGAGRLGGTTQYTVNNQMVNATLMNIAGSPAFPLSNSPALIMMGLSSQHHKLAPITK